MTVSPRIKPSGKNKFLDWNYRQQIPSELLLTRNAEMGIILYSNAELTAVDLVQFAGHIGGYQRAATVLSEMVDSVDIERMKEVFPYTTMATLQRLGYLLEFVIYEQEKADMLYSNINAFSPQLKRVLLSNATVPNREAPANRWHVNNNIEIELDEI